MKNLFDPAVRREVHDRLARLSPEAARRWGRMSAPEMVCHVGDQLRMALGDMQTKYSWTPLTIGWLRRLVVFRLPWPRGVLPTAPEMLSTRPGTWNADVGAVQALVARFEHDAARKDWPVHPKFGPLSRDEWGTLSYKHTDHHLRQFGV